MPRWNAVLFALAIVSCVAWMAGCSNSGGSESYGSVWTTLNGTGGLGVDSQLNASGTGVATTTGTTTASGTASAANLVNVLPAQPAVMQGDSLLIRVSVATTSIDGIVVKVAMSSSLGGTFDPAQGATENGVFFTTFKAPTNASGTSRITCFAGKDTGSCTVQVTPSPQSVFEVQVIPAAGLVSKGSSLPVSVRVADQNGAFLAEGEVVMFQSLDGTFEPAKGNLASGYFSSTFSPKVATGTCRLTALVKGLVGSCTITVTEAAPEQADSIKVSIVPALAALGQGQSTPLTVRVVNQRGEPVNGANVLLANSLDGKFDPSTGTTGNGVFSTVFTSGSTAGVCTLTATINGVSANTGIQVTVNPKITILPTNGSMSNGSSQPVSIKVQDDRGNLMGGVKVAVTSKIGGTFNQTSDTTENGFAYFTYTAPGLPGQEVITVQALGKTASASITIQ